VETVSVSLTTALLITNLDFIKLRRDMNKSNVS